jgi:hypothetical protein
MAAVDPNMLKQKDTFLSPSAETTSSIITPPLTPLSPEEQATLIQSLPMLLWNVQPSPKMDIAKTQSVIDKLKQAEYDNESVVSSSSSEEEAEKCDHHRRRRHSRRKEQADDDDVDAQAVQEKLQHFWSSHNVSVSISDDDDQVSISSAETSDDDDSGLFRY